MDWVVIAFLGLSLFLYCLLGGADFGAGVVELFSPPTHKEKVRALIGKAMGPVWEANHIWLIIFIVILFNGFPKVYTEVSIYFHIPLTLMLLGIVFRGCAFTFRTYDAVKDQSRELYSRAFSFSSLLTPLTFGMIIGGIMLGRVDPSAESYYAKFISPWLNLFCVSVGLFVLSIFTFLAAVFLIGETSDPQMLNHFSKIAKRANLIMVMMGMLVFAAAYLNGRNFFLMFFNHPLGVLGLAGATLPLVLLWRGLKTDHPWILRSIVGFQLAMILLAWSAVIYPNFIFYKNARPLTIFDSLAPLSTITILGWSLIIGSIFFLPALYYVILVFKIRDPKF